MTLPTFLGPWISVPLPSLPHFSPLGGAASKLGFTMQPQSQTEWCWAATSSSVCAFFGRAPLLSQCDVASSCLGLTCCVSPVPSPCNVPYYLDQALTQTGNMAGSFIVGSLPMADIINEVNAGRPICCHITWRKGQGGHFNAIYGYDNVNLDVELADPYYGNQTIPLSTFLTNYQNAGTWDYSYKTQ